MPIIAQKPHSSIRSAVTQIALGALCGLVLIGLLLPLLMGLHFKIHSAPAMLSDANVSVLARVAVTFAALVPFVLAVGVMSIRIVRARALLIALLLGILGSRLGFAALIDNEVISDYAVMWNFAVRVVSTGAFLPADSVPELRTVLFFLPAAYLSGGDAWGYQVANSLAITLTGLLLYLIAARVANQTAAFVALILFAFAPEPIFAVETVTHDIPGMLLIFLAIHVALSLFYRRDSETPIKIVEVIAYSVTCGVVLVLLELQRNIGLILFAAISLSFVVHAIWQDGNSGSGKAGFACCPARIHPVYLLLFVVLMIPIYLGGGAIAKRVLYSDHLSREISVWTASWATFHAHSQSVGSYSDYVQMKPYLDLLSAESRAGFTTSRSLSDLYHNLSDWPRAYARKTMRLYHLGRQGDEYFGEPTGRGLLGDWNQDGIAGSLRLYNLIYSVALIAISVVALVWFLSSPLATPLALLPALFLGLLTLALGLAGEIQSRYVFPAWAVLPFYVGIFVSAVRDVRLQPLLIRNWRATGISLVLGLGLVAVVYGAFMSKYQHESGRMIERREWSHEGQTSYPSSFVALLSSDSRIDPGISATLRATSNHLYAFTFFTRFTSETNSACRWATQLRVGTLRWDVDVVVIPEQPLLWTVSGLKPEQGLIPIGIKKGHERTHSENTPRCKNMSVEYSRITLTDSENDVKDVPTVRISGAVESNVSREIY